MTSIQEYNKHIADLLLQTYQKMIDKENEIIRGGGSFSATLPIMRNNEPPMCIQPETMRKQGGRLKIGKIIKDVGHVTGTVAKEGAKMIAPIAKKGVEKVATKVIDKVADHAINSLVNSMSGNKANQVAEGEGLKRKRGRPKKQGGSIEKKPRKKSQPAQKGGKFNFIKTIKSVGSKAVHTLENVAINKGIDQGIKYLSNPAVDETIAETAPVVAESAAGLKRKRKPSRRNLLIGKLMREHKMTMAQANAYLKKNNIK